jgi:Cu-Zn family superoxide dismutase
MGQRYSWAAAGLLVLLAGPALAAELTVPVNAVDASGGGAEIGSIRLRDGGKGLVLTPRLSGLSPGPHGIHVHENPSCQPKEQDGKMVPALAAGGHYDPHKAGRHEGPWGHGHLGDMPALSVDGDGTARDPLVAPHLKVADLKGRAIVIHAGADNYSDQPKPLGGGGGRVACGVVPAR